MNQQKNLEDSVGLMSIADVPVGVFLSGGIDSGLVAAELAQHNENIKAFTIQYQNHEKYNESKKAKIVANTINANHIIVDINEKDFFKKLSRMIYFLEEPISAPVCIPVMELVIIKQK